VVDRGRRSHTHPDLSYAWASATDLGTSEGMLSGMGIKGARRHIQPTTGVTVMDRRRGGLRSDSDTRNGTTAGLDNLLDRVTRLLQL
jgi:hypothetical protein